MKLSSVCSAAQPLELLRVSQDEAVTVAFLCTVSKNGDECHRF